jgi:hypothetical protein
MRASPSWLLLAPFLLASIACSPSGNTIDGGQNGSDVFIPLSCGSTGDCISAGLDADTCVYRLEGGTCAYGECRVFTLEVDVSKCTPPVTVCPCSPALGADGEEESQTIPACWQGFSPIGVGSIGACRTACTPTCANGTTCVAPTDCASGTCNLGKCVSPACAPTCAYEHICGANDDCITQVCTDGQCRSPACSPQCPIGQVCAVASDCASGLCTVGGRCASGDAGGPLPEAGSPSDAAHG